MPEPIGDTRHGHRELSASTLIATVAVALLVIPRNPPAGPPPGRTH